VHICMHIPRTVHMFPWDHIPNSQISTFGAIIVMHLPNKSVFFIPPIHGIYDPCLYICYKYL